MSHPDALGLLLLGGGAAAAALWWRARDRAATTTDPTRSATDPSKETTTSSTRPDTGTWIVPVPALSDRRVVVSNEFRAQPSTHPKAQQHLGIDLMFRRRDARDLIAAYPAGTSGGTAMFFMPDGIPALAASTGVVTFAAMTPVGKSVILRHPNGWASYYTHLQTLDVRPKQLVTPGASLGTIGANPLDAEHLRHLHFELWPDGRRSSAVDPAPFLAAWQHTTLAWSPTPINPSLVASASTSLRNSALSSYRTVGDRGEPYPTWVRNLRGASGVYVIREIDGPIVYVGSSVGKLYETVTRHLQAWRRYKRFWKGQYTVEGADPGLTYERNTVEVAIKLTSATDAHDEERRFIRRLHPRDNQLGQPAELLEDAPF